MKKCVSLKELFDNGIQYLEYGGYIKFTDDGSGNYYYDLYRDDDIEDGLLLCDGETLDFGEWQDNGKYIVGSSEYGKQIYLTKKEYDIAVFESRINKIIEDCDSLKADEALTILKFGVESDLELYIHKDCDYEPNIDVDAFNIVTISTKQNGKWVDDTGDVHVSDLYRQLERIYNYQNFETL